MDLAANLTLLDDVDTEDEEQEFDNEHADLRQSAREKLKRRNSHLKDERP
jgi:hypothetical protein